MTLHATVEGGIVDRRPAAALRADLAHQGKLHQSLLALADEVRRAGEAVATAVEGVLWELDRERRGDLSAAARQDASGILDTIRSLLQGDLLNERARAQLVQMVRDELPKEPSTEPPQMAGFYGTRRKAARKGGRR